MGFVAGLVAAERRRRGHHGEVTDPERTGHLNKPGSERTRSWSRTTTLAGWLATIAAFPFGAAASTPHPRTLRRSKASAVSSSGSSPLATEPGEHNINLGIACYAASIDGRVITLDANLDISKQVTDFDQLLAQGADVLAFLPLDHDAFVGPFERAADAGAVVVEPTTLSRPPRARCTRTGASAGEDAVLLVADQFPGAKALVIGGPPIPVIAARISGFTDNAEANGIEILEQQDNLNDNVNDARTLAEALIGKHPDVDVIFAFNDNSAIGAGLRSSCRTRRRHDLRDQRHRRGIRP